MPDSLRAGLAYDGAHRGARVGAGMAPNGQHDHYGHAAAGTQTRDWSASSGTCSVAAGMNRGDRELELLLREADRVVDRGVAMDRESEFEHMAMLGAVQGLARLGSGLGRVSGGLSRLS